MKLTYDRLIKTSRDVNLLTPVENDRAHKKLLAFQDIVIPELEKLLSFEISESTFKNHFSFKCEGYINEPDFIVLIRYLNEEIAKVVFGEEWFSIKIAKKFEKSREDTSSQTKETNNN